MDTWDHHNRLHHPSFSSTLLDHIYRSIDDSSDLTMRNTKLKHHENNTHSQIPNDYFRSKHPKALKPHFFNHSTSSSSDSSNFSSSESDSFYRRSKSSPRISLPKPIRTTVEQRPNNKQEHGSFLKTKSKAYLKKVKQPISPGGRLATFLNSIFTGNTKKPTQINTTTTLNTPSTTTLNTPSTTTCSSASSFSRSCLSKTPSSTEKSKRSVRFCPVNVIFDEKDSSKNNKQHETSRHHHHHQNLEIRVMEENRRVIEAAKELLRTYQKKKISVEEEEEEDDDDDAVSCASSDLFELDNLSAIGIERYQEELPVYETTNPIISR